jgi:excisionase family DNA binding protein
MKYIYPTDAVENIDVSRYYTVKESSEILGLNRETVYRWIKAGKLKSEMHISGVYLIKGKEIHNYFSKRLV